jgi:hypothetical protein
MGGLLQLAFALTMSADGLVLPAAPPAAVTTTEVQQRYEISATLDVGTGRVEAVEMLTLENAAGLPISYLNLSVLPRAFGYVTLDEGVMADGTPVEAEWTTTTNLRLRLNEPLPPGTTTAIRVPFTLTVGSSGGAFTARTSRDRGVLSLGEWFPVLSVEHDSYAVGDAQVSYRADEIRVNLTTTEALPRNAVACPGLVDAPAERGTRWMCAIRDARDFSLVVNPRFRLTTRTVDGIELRVFTESVSGETTIAKAADALARLNDLYGRYPWADLVLAEVGADDGFSMEYPAAIHLTRTKVTDTYVIYHEVAHQWFYAQLGANQMTEPWLDEAFADFTARYLMGIGENGCSQRPVDSSIFAWPAGPTRGGDWQSCDGYFHTVFYRGTEFLNALRGAMGDKAFFAALREHIDANRFGITTARALLDRLQAASARDLTPIYERYLAAY